MTEQEKLAREWADYAKNVAVSSPEQQAAADFILAHTTPPTMEGVEWEHELHHFAGATADTGEDVVMVDPHGPGITVIDLDTEEVVAASPLAITPNGKRYKLVEATVSPDEKVAVDQPEHPKMLRTKDDFADAPDGTIVAKPGYIAVSKKCGEWVGMYLIRTDSTMAETGPYEVLRWGRGE